MKNNKKNCVICSNTRNNNLKLCKDCMLIKDFIRLKGIDIILDFIKNNNINLNTKIFLPSAPLY